MAKEDINDLKGVLDRNSEKYILQLFAVFLISGCVGPYTNCIKGFGNMTSEDFTVDKFHSVDIGVHITGSGGPVNLYVTQEAQHSLKIEGEKNILELLTVNVENGKLIISSSRCFTNIKPVNLFVSMEEVKDLAGSGKVNIVGLSNIDTDELRLSISGSGSFDLTMNAEKLDSNIEGSGKANLKGNSRVHNSVISGSGNIKAFNLSTERTDIKISGSGNAEVDTSKELNVNILGSGSVFYTGNTSVSQTVSGSGKIVKR